MTGSPSDIRGLKRVIRRALTQKFTFQSLNTLDANFHRTHFAQIAKILGSALGCTIPDRRRPSCSHGRRWLPASLRDVRAECLRMAERRPRPQAATDPVPLFLAKFGTSLSLSRRSRCHANNGPSASTLVASHSVYWARLTGAVACAYCASLPLVEPSMHPKG